MSRLKEIGAELRALYERERELVDEARPMLLGKHCIRRKGDHTCEITSVGASPMGHLAVNGVRVRDGKRGTREFYIGAISLCERIWDPRGE